MILFPETTERPAGPAFFCVRKTGGPEAKIQPTEWENGHI